MRRQVCAICATHPLRGCAPRRQVRVVSATHLLTGRAGLPALPPRLSQGLPPLLNSRPCFLGLGIKRALPALSCPSPVTAPHASAVVPKDLMPEAAPARVASPRGSTALAPHFGSHPECVPRMSELSAHVPVLVTDVKTSLFIGDRSQIHCARPLRPKVCVSGIMAQTPQANR